MSMTTFDSEKEDQMTADVVRYGILSTAKIGLNKHIPSSRNSANSQVIAISSRTANKAREVALENGIQCWYPTYDELIGDPDIDAVINTLPISMHCEWTIKSAEAGKHILCEKPLSVTVEEARRMIDAANANNVLLVEAFTHRWNPHLRAARKLISEGAIGYITGLDSALSSFTEPSGNIRFSKSLAGGSLRDRGSYAVYAVRFAMSAEPIRATGISYDSGEWGIDTTFTGLLEFPCGAVARVGSSLEQPKRCELIVLGSEGQMQIPDMFDDSGPLIVTKGDKRQVLQSSAPDRFTVQLDEFSECILTGKSPEFPAKDGMRNMAAIVALQESATSGTIVDVEQIL